MSKFDRIIDRSGTGSLKWERYAGRDVIPLWVADMDFASPNCILNALRARVDHEVMGYTYPVASTVETTLDYLRRQHGIEASAEQLHWLPGIVPALNLLCQAFVAPGEAMMTATPVYPPFLTAPTNQGAEVQAIPLQRASDRWTFDFTAMEAAVSPATKMFILCNPHNPVGRVFDRNELTALVDFCDRHDLILVSDEIHCDLILDTDVKHQPTSTLGSEAAARAITLMSPSKTYNIPGLACAFAILPDSRLRARFKRACNGIITEINCFGYAGCEAAYRDGEPWRQELLDVLRRNRDRVYHFFAAEIPEANSGPCRPPTSRGSIFDRWPRHLARINSAPGSKSTAWACRMAEILGRPVFCDSISAVRRRCWKKACADWPARSARPEAQRFRACFTRRINFAHYASHGVPESSVQPVDPIRSDRESWPLPIPSMTQACQYG